MLLEPLVPPHTYGRRNVLCYDQFIMHDLTPCTSCQVLVRLGPAFVKIGQALSSRPDVLPPEYITELELLQVWHLAPIPLPGSIGNTALSISSLLHVVPQQLTGSRQALYVVVGHCIHPTSMQP